MGTENGLPLGERLLLERDGRGMRLHCMSRRTAPTARPHDSLSCSGRPRRTPLAGHCERWYGLVDCTRSVAMIFPPVTEGLGATSHCLLAETRTPVLHATVHSGTQRRTTQCCPPHDSPPAEYSSGTQD